MALQQWLRRRQRGRSWGSRTKAGKHSGGKRGARREEMKRMGSYCLSGFWGVRLCLHEKIMKRGFGKHHHIQGPVFISDYSAREVVLRYKHWSWWVCEIARLSFTQAKCYGADGKFNRRPQWRRRSGGANEKWLGVPERRRGSLKLDGTWATTEKKKQVDVRALVSDAAAAENWYFSVMRRKEGTLLPS